MTSFDLYCNHSAEFLETLVVMDDNSRPHRAHLVNEIRVASMFSRHEPYRLGWDTLKMAVFGRDGPSTTLRDLCRFAVEEWDNLDQQDVDGLVDSMPLRIHACINARGHATGY